MDLTFEKAMEELNALVMRLEAGSLSLEDSLAAYQRGVELSRYIEGLLSGAEKKVQMLMQNGELVDFEEEKDE